MSDSKFRILSLDGGGLRGVITTKILIEVERQIGQPLNQYFDLIAGTSTGSIIAAGLVTGLAPQKLLEIYTQEGKTIFPEPQFTQQIAALLNKPKYSNKGLKQVLQKYLGNYTLSNLHASITPTPKSRLLILAFNTVRRSTTFFLSPLVDAAPWYKEVMVWEACAASAAAPTFFPPYEFQGKMLANDNQEVDYHYTLVDGGVSVNNPALAALIHTLDIEKRPLSEISVLSIGTGRTTKPLAAEEIEDWGLLRWASSIPDVLMGAQLQIASDLCGQLLYTTNADQYLRLQFELNQRFDAQGKLLPLDKQVNRFLVPPEKISERMDNLSAIDQLERATDAFLNSTAGYRWVESAQRRLTVKEAIAHYIAHN